jgi:hypothetical protein
VRRPILILCICGGLSLFAAAPAGAQSLSPIGYTFPATQVGTKSPVKTFTLTAGAVPLASNVSTTSATFPQSNDCPATLLPLSSCIINVVFAPTKTAPQRQTGVLLAGGQEAALSGTVIGNLQPAKKCRKKKGKSRAAAAKKKKCKKKKKK